MNAFHRQSFSSLCFTFRLPRFLSTQSPCVTEARVATLRAHLDTRGGVSCVSSLVFCMLATFWASSGYRGGATTGRPATWTRCRPMLPVITISLVTTTNISQLSLFAVCSKRLVALILLQAHQRLGHSALGTRQRAAANQGANCRAPPPGPIAV